VKKKEGKKGKGKQSLGGIKNIFLYIYSIVFLGGDFFSKEREREREWWWW